MRRYVLSVFVVGLAVALSVGVATATAGGNSPNAKLCQKNGWKTQYTSTGQWLTSEEACVSYAATGRHADGQVEVATRLRGGRGHLLYSTHQPIRPEPTPPASSGPVTGSFLLREHLARLRYQDVAATGVTDCGNDGGTNFSSIQFFSTSSSAGNKPGGRP